MSESVCEICGKTVGQHHGVYRFCDSPSATGRTFTPSWYQVEIETSEEPLRIPRVIPAGTVLVSEDFVDAVRAMLSLLKRRTCWCEVAIGNPMYREHTEGCKKAAMVESMLSDMNKEA